MTGADNNNKFVVVLGRGMGGLEVLGRGMGGLEGGTWQILPRAKDEQAQWAEKQVTGICWGGRHSQPNRAFQV